MFVPVFLVACFIATLGGLPSRLISSYKVGVGNPFEGAYFFPNPNYAKEVASSVALHPSLAPTMNEAAKQSAALWMDTVDHISDAGDFLEAALSHAKTTGNTTLVTLIVYDVPDRDCAAQASAGQFVCADEACTAGINDYKTQYIAPIQTMLAKYEDPSLRIVLIIEPDSLPNLATNLDLPKCDQAQTAYKTCIAYAIQMLSTYSNTWLYVDAAHGGWLGWPDNYKAFGGIMAEVLTSAGSGSLSKGVAMIRGFSDNVANYQWLGSVSNTDDPCDLASQYNFCNNEAVYMKTMNEQLVTSLGQAFYWVTDTGRNGQEDARVGTTQCQQWCNIKNTGLGYKPTTDVSPTGLSGVLDAMFWLKTPGESDGTTNTSSPHYDAHCSSAESVQPAPEAGDWFDEDFAMLAAAAIW